MKVSICKDIRRFRLKKASEFYLLRVFEFLINFMKMIFSVLFIILRSRSIRLPVSCIVQCDKRLMELLDSNTVVTFCIRIFL